MQRTTIKTVTNITEAISNLASGDIVFFDIDETLILTGFKKFSDDPRLTEQNLATAISRLQERGIQVRGLTSRSNTEAAKTIEQLQQAGIKIEVIHAPDIKSGDSGKGRAIREYLTTCQDPKPKRIFVFDNLRKHLESIKAECSDFDIPLLLKHYSTPDYQPINIDADTNSFFPDKLEGFNKEHSLGGGTASVFSIKHQERQQKLVVKLGAHEDGAKIEMLCNAIYRILGVKVPKMRVYHTLPKSLAAELGLGHPYRYAQVCEFIQSGKPSSAAIIKQAARDHFVAHALLGNIDVAKEDNFIVDEQKTAYLIDAGANFLFRSLGELRKEPPALVSEMETLRDKSFNDKGPDWFGDLTDEEIRQQLIRILGKQHELTSAVWDLSQHLQLSDELRDKFLQSLSDRLDTLVTHYIHQQQQHAKVDKRAKAGNTSAGILTYAMKDGELHVLLSKRVRHEWWDNFGGKSEAGDESLLATACREVAEESGQLLNYTDLELQVSPFHDIVTVSDSQKQQLYRMYIAPYDCIPASRFKDKEHTAHQWVPLKSILAALHANQVERFEGKDTIVVKAGKTSIPLFPPLCVMLQQQPVRDNLDELLRFGKMKHRRTLGYHCVTEQDAQIALYRPVITPTEKRQQISSTLEKKSRMMRELKHKLESKPSHTQTSNVFSQSEIHLKAILGSKYQPDNLVENVRIFVSEHFSSAMNSERLVQQAVALIEREKQGGTDHTYFYHACSNSIAFAYDVYTALYQALQQDSQWSAFRPDSEHFKRFLSINEFIAFYSEQGKKDINNNDKNYNDCALSANVFLFGNHNIDTSCSINYLMNNDTRRTVDLSALFTQLLSPFQVTTTEVKRLLQLFDQHCSQQAGTLYQIAMPNEQARMMSYPAGCVGVLNEFEGDRVLPSILNKLRATTADAKSVSSAATKYVSRLQARVMVPPHQKLTTYAVKWQQVTEEKQAEYQSSLQQIVKAFVHKILCHHRAVDSSHAAMPLIKILPAVLRDNQLSYSSVASDQVLVRAILAGDAVQIRNILQRQPELLNKKIKAWRDYIGGGAAANDKDTTILAMLLDRPDIPLDVIFDFSASNIVEQIDGLQLNSYIDLNRLLIRFPDIHRLSLLVRNIPLANQCQSWFLDVFKLLPADARLSFLAQYPHVIQQLRCVVGVSKLLPADCRLDYLIKNMADIHDFEYLICTSWQEEDRLKHARLGRHLIKDANDLCVIIIRLPVSAWLAFAKEHRHLVHGYSDILTILNYLSGSDELEFARFVSDCIEDGFELSRVLYKLMPSNRLTFALEQLDKIHSAAELREVIYYIPPPMKSDFIFANAFRIKPGDSINSLVSALDQDRRLEFAKAHRQNIKNAYELWGVLFEINACDRFDFACQSASMINKASEVTAILNILPASQKFEFARLHQDKIINAGELCEVSSCFQAAERLSFLQANMDKIQDTKQCELVADMIPECDRIKFVTEYQKLHGTDLLPRISSNSRQNGFFARDKYDALDDFTVSEQNANLNLLPFRYTK